MIRSIKYLLAVCTSICWLVAASKTDSILKLEKHHKAEIVERTRALMQDSSFHVYLGHKMPQGEYSLNHVCSFADATYIFGMGPNLRPSSSIVSFIDHDLYEASPDLTPLQLKFVTLEFTNETIPAAYSLTLRILTAGNTKKIRFHGVIFEFRDRNFVFDFAFDADVSEEALREFAAFYSKLKCVEGAAPHTKCISFDKVPVDNMKFRWNLSVNALDRTLITVRNKKILLGLLDYIHPAYFSDITLVRSDQREAIRDTDLHELSYTSHIKKTGLIVHHAIQNIEFRDKKILGTRMNKGLDSVVAISFGELQDQTIDIKFKYLPDTQSMIDQEIDLKEAISQMEGFWSFTQKYFKTDYWRFTNHREVLLDVWQWQDAADKSKQSQHTLRSVSDFLSLCTAETGWPCDSFPDNISMVMRLPDARSVSKLPPFVRLGFADFLKTDLPIILVRLYNLLFTIHYAEWIELIDSVIVRPAGQTMQVETVGTNSKYEVLIGIREGPSIKDMDLQVLMADIMHGVSHAASFANGLVKCADGSVPVLQFGNQAYHKQALADIEKNIKITRLKNDGKIGTLQAFSFLYQPFQCYSLGPVESAFDDVFLNSIDVSTQIGTFLVLSRQALTRSQLDNFTAEINKEDLLEFMRSIPRWTSHAKTIGIDTLHGIAIQVTPIKKELGIEGMIRLGFGFTTNSSVEERKTCTEFFGIDFSTCKGAGLGNLMDEFDKPFSIDDDWNFTFKHGDEIVTRSFNDLTKLKYYISWFKTEVLRTSSLVLNHSEKRVGPKIVVDCKDMAILRLLLFDQIDMWNNLICRTWIYLWREVFKIEFGPSETDPENGISVVFHLKFNDVALYFAKHLHRRRGLLALIDPFQFSFNLGLTGKLKVGDHVQYILGSSALYKSMGDWPKELKKKDTACFRKIEDPLVGSNVDRIHAIRVVVKTQEAIELFALLMTLMSGRIGPELASAGHYLMVRNVSAHTSEKKLRNRIPHDHYECILAFSRVPGAEMFVFAKISFLLISVLETPVIDISAGVFSMKNQLFTASQKLAIEQLPSQRTKLQISKIVQNVVQGTKRNDPANISKGDLEANLRKAIAVSERAQANLIKATENTEIAKKNLEAAQHFSEDALSILHKEISNSDDHKSALRAEKKSVQDASKLLKGEDVLLREANERLTRIKRLERKRQAGLDALIQKEKYLEAVLQEAITAGPVIQETDVIETEAIESTVDLCVRLHTNNRSLHATAIQRRRLPMGTLSSDTFY